MTRILLKNMDSEAAVNAESVLDAAGIHFALDEGGRFIVNDIDVNDACEALENADIDFDFI